MSLLKMILEKNIIKVEGQKVYIKKSFVLLHTGTEKQEIKKFLKMLFIIG